MKKIHLFTVILTAYLSQLNAQTTTIYADNFETPQTWTIFEELVGNDPCYGNSIGEVAPVNDLSHDGTKALRVWSNKGGSTKSNHVIAAHHISNTQGITGRLKYSMWVNNATTIGLTQSSPEFSVQSTRRVGSQNLTYIAGIQYIGNQWVTDKWNIWHNGTWKTIKLSEFGTTLSANTWYYLELEFDMTQNIYIGLRIQGGGINAYLNLNKPFLDAPLGFKIGEEARNWTPSYFVTAESENLWSACSQVHEDKVYYDDILLESVAVLPVELLSFSAHTEGVCDVRSLMYDVRNSGNYDNQKSENKMPCRTVFNWETASEINVNSFELQRLNKANNYETIATIKAENKANKYSFVMNEPLKGINYYRLEINDFDEKSAFSEIISLENTELLRGIKIYPNPVNDVLFIENTEEKNVEIINSLGQVVLTFQKLKTFGKLDVSDLQNGFYFVKMGIEMVRFIKN
jgi:hypothetical protein